MGPNDDDDKRRRDIPADLLIAEVLIHLPAKSLARCRCVCRSWRAGIAAAAFVRRHRDLSRLRPPPSVLAIPRGYDPDDRHATSTELTFHRIVLPPRGHLATDAELFFDTAWPDGITHILYTTHCDGLVAIATAIDKVFVCNPATREIVALPLGSHNAELDSGEPKAVPVAIGFDRRRNSYVVGRYFYRTHGEIVFDEATGESSQDYDIGHEVFTLGGDGGGGGSWELTGDPPHAIRGVQRPICTRRGFYWHSDVPKPRLMRFGLQDRAFEVVARPPTGGWSHLDDMSALDGKLCYVHAAAMDASFQLWMADDEGSEELQWSLRCRIQLPDLRYSFMPIIADGDDALVAAVGEIAMRYNVQDGSKEEVVDKQLRLEFRRQDGPKFISVVPYFETLVSPTTCNY